jgi:KDO2-lipid IV(A) lauroyltransferase
MYYLIYGFFYVVSLLPFPVLYFISSIIYFFVYYVFGYRKEIVMGNIVIAFPEKSIAERAAIAKQFYKNFTDSFIEMLKAFSLSDAQFDKRCTGNFEVINEVLAKGKKIQLVGAHMFNWEYANLVISRHITIAPLGVYGTVENKLFERILLKLRSKYGTILVSTVDFKNRMQEITSKQYCMYLLADQNPLPHNSIWINFFGKPAPFIPGPYKAAIKNNAAIIFINFKKIKRGYYSFWSEVVIENPADYSVEELIKKYRDFIEDIIRRQPENYLWSHRRWKYDYKDFSEKYQAKLISD